MMLVRLVFGDYFYSDADLLTDNAGFVCLKKERGVSYNGRSYSQRVISVLGDRMVVSPSADNAR